MRLRTGFLWLTVIDVFDNNTKPTDERDGASAHGDMGEIDFVSCCIHVPCTRAALQACAAVINYIYSFVESTSAHASVGVERRFADLELGDPSSLTSWARIV